jgi:polyvinyl alcohol dehydrogenase (cytochrome)
VSDFGGCFTALNKNNGSIIYQKNLTSDYGLLDKAISRNTPTYSNGMIVIPMSARWGFLEYSMGIWLLTVNASNGDLKWKVLVSSYNRSVLTGSPTIDNGKIYIGLTSTEEAEQLLAGLQGRQYTCCGFGGRMLSYSLSTGSKLWDTPMIPDELTGVGKYSGAGIWSSGPSILGDYIFVSTGNLYNQSQESYDCYALNPTNSSCVPRSVLYDSVVKLNKNTGEIVASFRASETDVWNAACYLAGYIPGCPVYKGLDADFGNAPMLTEYENKTYVALGQKSGIFWLLNSDDLSVVWKKMVGPSGGGGGFQYGSSVNDNNQIFGASANTDRTLHTTINGEVINFGSWVRLNMDGKIKWETPSPTNDTLRGPLTTTNNVVFATTDSGTFCALSAITGEILWKYNTGVLSVSGPTVDNRVIYWGSGPVINFVQNISPYPCKLYAFELKRDD